MSYVFNQTRNDQAKTFQDAAIRFREISLEVDKLAMLLNDAAEQCSCCGTTRYLFWAQRQLRARVVGASERLREIGDVFARRANDSEFLDGSAKS